MAPGQTIAIPQPQGLTALTLVEMKSQPATLAQAQGPIEQLLWNQKKRAALQAETKELRIKKVIKEEGMSKPSIFADQA